MKLETETPVIDEFVVLMAKEDVRFKVKRGALSGVYAKLEKLGIETKTTYTFPILDTLGKTVWEELQKGRTKKGISL